MNNNFLDFINKDIEAKKTLITNTPTKTKTNKKKATSDNVKNRPKNIPNMLSV